jgi:hypothetical protein
VNTHRNRVPVAISVQIKKVAAQSRSPGLLRSSTAREMFASRTAAATATPQGAALPVASAANTPTGGAPEPDGQVHVAGASPFEAAFACLQGMGEARSQEMALLEERRRVLVQQKKELQKDIKNKQQRAKRLMKKAVKDLSDEQLLQVAAARVASRAKARAKSTATSSAPTTAPLGSRTAAVSSPTEAADGDQSNA